MCLFKHCNESRKRQGHLPLFLLYNRMASCLITQGKSYDVEMLLFFDNCIGGSFDTQSYDHTMVKQKERKRSGI